MQFDDLPADAVFVTADEDSNVRASPDPLHPRDAF
jgi:hypothetical protein